MLNQKYGQGSSRPLVQQANTAQVGHMEAKNAGTNAAVSHGRSRLWGGEGIEFFFKTLLWHIDTFKIRDLFSSQDS